MIAENAVRSFVSIVEFAAGQTGNWSGERHHRLIASPHFADLVEFVPEMHPLGQVLRGETLTISAGEGSSSSANPAGFVRALVDDVLRLAVAETEYSSTSLPALGRDVLRSFAKNLEDGSSVTERFMGIRGLSIDGDAALDIGLGKLRSLKPNEAIWFQAFPGYPDVRAGETVLEWETTITWSVGSAEPPPSERRRLPTWMLLSLVLFMADSRTAEGKLRTPQQIWQVNSPFFHKAILGASQSPDLSWRSSGSPFDVVVDVEIATRARGIFGALGSEIDGPMELFVRRLALSLGVYVRSDEDRLVDAAVAWESLMGQKSSAQLSLQLSLGLAWLVEPSDATEREQVYRRLKKIYESRSKVVHGVAVPLAKVRSDFDDLSEILRSGCLRMFLDRQDLVHSTNRALDLMLGR